MFTMPLSPLILNKTSGDWMWTAASVLSLRTPKLEFDPALSKDFDDNQDAKTSGLSMLERYVIKLLDASFTDSSLFWHYAMRHVPSPSLMCAGDYSSTNYKPAGTNITFANDAGIPSDATNPDILTKVPRNNTSTSIPMYGYGAFPLGGAGTMCFCGWTRVLVNSVAWCEIPPAICRHPAVSYQSINALCRYRQSDAKNANQVIAKILDAWPAAAAALASASAAPWTCPELDLSDAWGIMPAKASDAWIRSGKDTSTNPTFDVSELLRAGRTGMRIGNAATLRQKAQAEGVWPSERVHKLLPDDNDDTATSSGAALKRCANNIMGSINAASVAKEIVDDLFPVAQGIYESAPMSFCLRYAIEYSRLRMLKAVRNLVRARQSGMQFNNAGGIEDEVMKQKSVTDLWKGKCESQLNMLAVCKGNGLFDVVPEAEFAYNCPFVITNNYTAERSYYVTPTGCLLYYGDSFYNPCRHTTKACGSINGQKVRYTLDEITGTAQRGNTRIKFDVRGTGSDEILGKSPVKGGCIMILKLIFLSYQEPGPSSSTTRTRARTRWLHRSWRGSCGGRRRPRHPHPKSTWTLRRTTRGEAAVQASTAVPTSRGG